MALLAILTQLGISCSAKTIDREFQVAFSTLDLKRDNLKVGKPVPQFQFHVSPKDFDTTKSKVVLSSKFHLTHEAKDARWPLYAVLDFETEGLELLKVYPPDTIRRMPGLSEPRVWTGPKEKLGFDFRFDAPKNFGTYPLKLKLYLGTDLNRVKNRISNKKTLPEKKCSWKPYDYYFVIVPDHDEISESDFGLHLLDDYYWQWDQPSSEKKNLASINLWRMPLFKHKRHHIPAIFDCDDDWIFTTVSLSSKPHPTNEHLSDNKILLGKSKPNKLEISDLESKEKLTVYREDAANKWVPSFEIPIPKELKQNAIPIKCKIQIDTEQVVENVPVNIAVELVGSHSKDYKPADIAVRGAASMEVTTCPNSENQAHFNVLFKDFGNHAIEVKCKDIIYSYPVFVLPSGQVLKAIDSESGLVGKIETSTVSNPTLRIARANSSAENEAKEEIFYLNYHKSKKSKPHRQQDFHLNKVGSRPVPIELGNGPSAFISISDSKKQLVSPFSVSQAPFQLVLTNLGLAPVVMFIAACSYNFFIHRNPYKGVVYQVTKEDGDLSIKPASGVTISIAGLDQVVSKTKDGRFHLRFNKIDGVPFEFINAAKSRIDLSFEKEGWEVCKLDTISGLSFPWSTNRSFIVRVHKSAEVNENSENCPICQQEGGLGNENHTNSNS